VLISREKGRRIKNVRIFHPVCDWRQALPAFVFASMKKPEHAQEPLVLVGDNEVFTSCRPSLTGGS